MIAHALYLFNITLCLLFEVFLLSKGWIGRRFGERTALILDTVGWSGLAFASCSTMVEGDTHMISDVARALGNGLAMLHMGRTAAAQDFGFGLAVRMLANTQWGLIEHGLIIFVWGWIIGIRMEAMRKKLRETTRSPNIETAPAAA